MSAGEAMLVPGWLLLGGAAMSLMITLLLAALCNLSLRKAQQLDRLTAQLSQTGDTFAREAHASQEITQALQQQLGDAMTQLRLARDQASRADQANQAKSAFLAKMSHELRTPLSAIIGFAEMIEQQSMGPIGNLKYRDYAGDIRHSGQHLLSIINDILDLSKVESGRESLREETIPADDLLHGVRVLLEGRPQEAGVKLDFDCPDDLPAILADRRRLTQILVNLLSNAIKFTPAGGKVTLRCWATAGSGFVFQVIDTGVGIARDDIPVALSVFGQVDNAMGNQVKGTGLGLPLAKALAELHGGTLDLQSEVGKGTTVTLRLPAHRMAAPAREKADTAARAAAG